MHEDVDLDAMCKFDYNLSWKKIQKFYITVNPLEIMGFEFLPASSPQPPATDTTPGGVSERPKVTDSKSVVGQPTGSSNLPPSAIQNKGLAISG